MHRHLVAPLVSRGLSRLATRQQDIGGGNDLPDLDMSPTQMWVIGVTAFVGIIALYLVVYTLGELIPTLAIIESPSGNSTNQPIPPQQYSDETSADPLLEPEAGGDVEMVVVLRRPITSKIRTTIAHLSRISGFRARFRGMGFGIAYSIVYSVLTQLATYGLGAIGTAFATVIMSLLLARLHMFWTHAMIASPQSKQWRRLPRLRDCKALILPALVYAMAQEAMIIPFAVANLLGLIGADIPDDSNLLVRAEPNKTHAVTGLSIFAVMAVYALIMLAIVIPASITLTRIEAFLLPDGDDTIVPFDKATIAGGIDFNAAGHNRALFLRAWRTFSRDGWWRLFKIYAKLIAAEFGMSILIGIVIGAEMAILG